MRFSLVSDDPFFFCGMFVKHSVPAQYSVDLYFLGKYSGCPRKEDKRVLCSKDSQLGVLDLSYVSGSAKVFARFLTGTLG